LINPLNTELNPICHLLALFEAHRILHVSRIRVKICSAYSKILAAFNNDEALKYWQKYPLSY
jgi:hypothetical protein